jgi:hypothetical protein
MDGLDYIVPAHEDGGEERVEETARVDRTNSASSDGAYRGCSGTEEGAPVVVGLPREIPSLASMAGLRGGIPHQR